MSRDLTLGTDGAVLLARLLQILARERGDGERDAQTRADLCCEIIARRPLDTLDGYGSARREADVLDPPDPESRPDVGLRNPLHVDALQRRFRLAQVYGPSDGTVRVSYPPGAEFTLVSDSVSGRVTVALDGPDGDRLFERTPERLLCLFAVQETLAMTDMASRFTDIDRLRLANLWSGLRYLRLDIMAGLDPRTAYRRLMKLCDP